MIIRGTGTSARLIAFLTCLAAGITSAAEGPTALLGNKNWLFYKYELGDPSHTAPITKTIDLIKEFERALANRGIQLTVAMVPIKARIYAEFLPDDIKLSDYTTSNYDRMLGVFKSQGVNAADLNSAFLNSNSRTGDTPLFFRLDSHWTPTGAMVAAEAVKKSLEAEPRSAKALSSIPSLGYDLKIANRKRASRGRDLVDQLPPNAPVFEPEQVAQVNVMRTQKAQMDLLGNQNIPEIGLVGSSYSRDWTGFTDALRFVLQRDVIGVGVGADQGTWVGMESYLRDDAFQNKPPKLLIWEMPERDMHAPPDYKYREARYISGNADWLKRVTELIKKARPISKP